MEPYSNLLMINMIEYKNAGDHQIACIFCALKSGIGSTKTAKTPCYTISVRGRRSDCITKNKKIQQQRRLGIHEIEYIKN